MTPDRLRQHHHAAATSSPWAAFDNGIGHEDCAAACLFVAAPPGPLMPANARIAALAVNLAPLLTDLWEATQSAQAFLNDAIEDLLHDLGHESLDEWIAAPGTASARLASAHTVLRDALTRLANHPHHQGAER